MFRSFVSAVALLGSLASPALAQELRGHGGPVRALAVQDRMGLAISGSFDSSAILWRLDRGAAMTVLRLHDGSVNAVAALPDGRFATAGEDGRIGIWRLGRGEPEAVLTGHTAPIAALSVSADGSRIASAAWDGTARIWDLASGTAQAVLRGHAGQVNGVAFLPGGGIVTAGYDATVRLWTSAGEARRIVRLAAVLNNVLVAPDGELVLAGGDGTLRILSPDGDARAEMTIGEAPLVALAISRDGALLAAGGVRGQVAVIDRAGRRIRAALTGPGLPVWSLAFTGDGRELLSGGADRLVRRWNAVTGEHLGEVVPRAGTDVLAGLGDDRGARVFRACAACHTLTPDDGNRAGPTLHRVFGRRIGTAPGYDYSPALRNMDIVWNAETIARLFEIGPNAYTPGTKMPEQVIISAEDRRALVEWLERVTR